MSFIVYTKTGCPWCTDVTSFLHENNIPFEERNVFENPEYFTEMQQKSGQTKAPTFEIDGQVYGDSDVDELKKVLTEKGLYKEE
jgi:glutaredoxin